MIHICLLILLTALLLTTITIYMIWSFRNKKALEETVNLMNEHDRRFYLQGYESNRSDYLNILQKIGEKSEGSIKKSIDNYILRKNKLSHIFRIFGFISIVSLAYVGFFWDQIIAF